MPPVDNKLAPAFFSAHIKGRAAFREHGDKAECPYTETRGGRYNHVITFSRAFQKYWREGREDEKAGRPVKYERRPKRVQATAASN